MGNRRRRVELGDLAGVRRRGGDHAASGAGSRTLAARPPARSRNRDSHSDATVPAASPAIGPRVSLATAAPAGAGGHLGATRFLDWGVRDAAVLTLLAVLGGGAAFAAVEQDVSAWDGVWWAITTVTTVGYGDVAVSTDGGRIIGICLMITGIGFVAVLTAAAADRFVRQRGEEQRAIQYQLAEILRRLDSLERL
jgi:hypothetical protein